MTGLLPQIYLGATEEMNDRCRVLQDKEINKHRLVGTENAVGIKPMKRQT